LADISGAIFSLHVINRLQVSIEDSIILIFIHIIILSAVFWLKPCIPKKKAPEQPAAFDLAIEGSIFTGRPGSGCSRRSP
jgi:hypothetical protein